MKNVSLIILFGTLIMISCTKNVHRETILVEKQNISVTGKVTDKTTGLGLTNIPVMISGCKRPVCCVPTARVCTFSDTNFTDSNGNYKISFNSVENTDYGMVTMGNSTFYNDSINYVSISTERTNEISFILSPVKILQVNMKILNANKNSFNLLYSTTKSNYFSGAYLIQRSSNISNFDTTLNLKALALSNYSFFTESCNFYSGVYTNCNLSVDTTFLIQNVDTTKVNFIIH